MATRGKTTFQKRQKETARKERRQKKAERREHRRVARSVEEKTPPQDPAEISAEHDGFERTNRSADWRVLREHSNP